MSRSLPDAERSLARLHLGLPPEWLAVDIDSVERQADALEAYLLRWPQLERLRDAIAREQHEVSADAAHRHVVLAAVLFQALDDTTLLQGWIEVMATPSAEVVDAREAAQSIARDLAEVRPNDTRPPDVELITLPVGPAVRVRRTHDAKAPDGRSGLVTEVLEHHVPVAGRSYVVVVRGMTPSVLLAEPVIDSIDAAMATLEVHPSDG